MAFNAKGLTSKGRNLQAKAQAGAELKYTKFVMGDGVLGNQSIGNLTNVISPKKTVTVTRVFVVPSDQRANVGMFFTNADVTTAFTWREIGLYAIDPDEGEILYWYGYDVGGAEIPVGGGSEILEQTFDTMVFVGTAQNVSSTVNTSLVFATLTEMNQVLADSKAYTDTKFASATIPDASLTQKGKVQLTIAIDSTSQTLAATAKAVSDARQAAVTAAQAHSEEVILPQANANAQNYVNAKVWQKFPLTQDDGKVIQKVNVGFNSLVDPGFYYTTGTTSTVTNAPEPTISWFVEVLVFSPNTKVQRATQKDTSRVYLRQTDSAGNWSAWVLQTPEENLWGAL